MIQPLRKYWPSRDQHQQVWSLSWPLMLSNITVPMLGLVDTAVIGHLPESYHLGAVAVGSMIFSILYWSFGFLRMGTTGMTAQAYGDENGGLNRQLLAQSMILAFAIGFVLLLFQQPIIQIALQLMDAETIVDAEARRYSEIRILGAPAVLCNYAILGWFVGNQNTRIPLLLLLVTNIMNMVLDVIAVYGLGMHADGVAAATVCSEYFALGLGVYLIRRQLRKVPGQLELACLNRLKDYRNLIVVNRYLFVRTLLLLGSLAFFTAQGAKQGTDILSANAVLLNFLILIANCLDGFAHATEALSGKYIGARKLREFYQSVTSALLWSVVTAGLLALTFFLFGGLIIDLLTGIEQVRSIAKEYLAWIVLLPLIGVWSFLLDGIFVGTTQFRAMQNTMLFTIFVVFLPLWWATQSMGNHGLWLSLMSVFVARAVSGGYVYWKISKQQRWLPHD